MPGYANATDSCAVLAVLAVVLGLAAGCSCGVLGNLCAEGCALAGLFGGSDDAPSPWLLGSMPSSSRLVLHCSNLSSVLAASRDFAKGHCPFLALTVLQLLSLALEICRA